MGVATLTHRGRTFRFRCDPTDIKWFYGLNTKVEQTYGGQVVQILSAKIDALEVTADSGNGRWNHLYSLLTFCRDLLFDQKNTGEPAVFSFPPRGWTLKVFLSNFPYTDSWQNVTYPFTLRFKVQEDVTGVLSSETISSELSRIREGIGYERNEYNYPTETEDEEGSEKDKDKDD